MDSSIVIDVAATITLLIKIFEGIIHTKGPKGETKPATKKEIEKKLLKDLTPIYENLEIIQNDYSKMLSAARKECEKDINNLNIVKNYLEDARPLLLPKREQIAAQVEIIGRKEFRPEIKIFANSIIDYFRPFESLTKLEKQSSMTTREILNNIGGLSGYSAMVEVLKYFEKMNPDSKTTPKPVDYDSWPSWKTEYDPEKTKEVVLRCFDKTLESLSESWKKITMAYQEIKLLQYEN
jgi:hypothetical protein